MYQALVALGIHKNTGFILGRVMGEYPTTDASMSTRKKLLPTILLGNACLAVYWLFLAYRAHSVKEAILAVVLYLVVLPLVGVWWVRHVEPDKGKE